MILLKFAIVCNIFDYFCPFVSSTIITAQRSFSGLADGLLDINPERKNSFECSLRNLIDFVLNFAILQILKNRFFIWFFTNIARKLKVAESNQAKASLI